MYLIGQASPDSLDSGDPNGELVNGTGDEHPESDGDRRPSLNASTPDDDLSFRERTSTVPTPPVRAIAQVYMDQSAAAQSQPDLLGLPYTTHENVLLRKRNMNNSLSVSPETSRLSMPPFVFSTTSLRSFENTPSTSSSYANDMSLRIVNESENTAENSDDASLNDHVSGNLNDEMENPSSSMLSEILNICDNSGETSTAPTSLVLPSCEVEIDQGTPSEPEVNMEEVNIDETGEEQDIQTNTVPMNDLPANEPGCSAEDAVSDTVVEEGESVSNARNIDDVNIENEETSDETTVENNNSEHSSSDPTLVTSSEPSLFLDSSNNSPSAQQDSTESADVASSSEDSSDLALQQLSQHEVLIVDIPPDEPETSLEDENLTEELSRPVNDVDEGTNEDVLQENSNIEANNSLTMSDSDTGTANLQHLSRDVETLVENNITQNPVDHTNLTRLERSTTGHTTSHSFMDVESEPDIMDVLSLSTETTSDIVMPTQAVDVEGSSPRRNVNTCNLRTLFQIPDRESVSESTDNSVGRTQQDDATSSHTVTLENHDGHSSNDGSSNPSSCDLAANGSENILNILPSNSTSVIDNPSGDSNELDNVEVLDVHPNQLEIRREQDVRTTTSTTQDEQNNTSIIDTSLLPQTSIDNQPGAQRPSNPSPIPSITHVRYLRSKNVSIRLPSRNASPLPVVHVVPPNVPVSSRNSPNDFPSSPIEAEPILPATRLDSSGHEASVVTTRSLARDVFDAPDGSREAVNVGASTSHAGPSLVEPPAGAQSSSAASTSNSAPKRRSSTNSSQSGSTRNKRKNKLRNRTGRHSSSNAHPEVAESLEQAQPSRRINEERPSRNHTDDTTEEETIDESNPSHRPASIYVQISDFARDEDVLDEPLPPRK